MFYPPINSVADSLQTKYMALLRSLGGPRYLSPNIAEGFKKNKKRDKARYMNIAQGSLEECRYYSILAKDLGYCDTSELMDQLEEVSKLFQGYMSSILDSIS